MDSEVVFEGTGEALSTKTLYDHPVHRELDFAIGTMTDGAEVDEALREFGRIDSAMWTEG